MPLFQMPVWPPPYENKFPDWEPKNAWDNAPDWPRVLGSTTADGTITHNQRKVIELRRKIEREIGPILEIPQRPPVGYYEQCPKCLTWVTESDAIEGLGVDLKPEGRGMYALCHEVYFDVCDGDDEKFEALKGEAVCKCCSAKYKVECEMGWEYDVYVPEITIEFEK